MSDAMPITATVHLAGRDKAGFEAALAARYTPGSASFHKWMSRAELAAFAPTDADLKAVTDSLTGYGLTVTGSNASGTSLTVQGSASAMRRAFNTRLHVMMSNGRKTVAKVTPVQAQGALFGRVAAVSGLAGTVARPMNVRVLDATTGQAIPGVPVPAAGTSAASVLASFTNKCFGPDTSVLLSNSATSAAYEGITYAFSGQTCAYTPKQIAKHYGIDQLYKLGLDGTGQTIVIVDAYGDPTALSDANTFFAATGITPFTSSNFQIITPAGAPAVADYGWAGETALDIEMAHAIAPGAKIILAVAPDNNDSSLQAVVQYVIDQHLGNVVSNSYGESEGESDSDTIYAWNQLGEEAAFQGISLNFSSGDDGDYSVATGVVDVSSPSDSPWVTSVGGTSLGIPSGNGVIETGWGNYRAQLGYVTAPADPAIQQGFFAGGGGGSSAYFAKPFWQRGTPGTGRQEPDLAMIADPYTGALVVLPTSATTASVFESIGGTSVASPVFSALWALADEAAGLQVNGTLTPGATLGIPGPLLRYMPKGSLHDSRPIKPTTQLTGTITDAAGTTVTDGFSLLGINPDPGALTVLRLRTDGGYSALSFNTDTSLATTIGYDNATGYGVPVALPFVAAAIAIQRYVY